MVLSAVPEVNEADGVSGSDRDSDGEEVRFQIIPAQTSGTSSGDDVPYGYDDSADDDESSFICQACGVSKDTQRGLNVHIGHMHPDRKDLQKTSSRRSSTRRVTPDSEIDYDGSSSRKPKGEAAAVKRAILKDFNPLIVDALCATGIPRPAMSLPLPTGRTLEQEIKFSDTQADWIARGVVGMKATPVVVKTARVVGPVAPYAFGAVALLIVGVHAFKLWTLRNLIIETIKTSMMNGQQTAGSPDSGNDKPHYI